jgi:hypothetical protein
MVVHNLDDTSAAKPFERLGPARFAARLCFPERSADA